MGELLRSPGRMGVLGALGLRVRLSLACGLMALTGGLVLGSAPALAVREYFPGASFGEPCSSQPCGGGQFTEPTGVAVDDSTEPLAQPAAGDVYVIDVGDNRVERFSSTGAYISQFDGSETPAKSFSLVSYQSGGIAVDNSGRPLVDPSAGDVYVEDSGNKVIDKFSSEGKYIGQLKETLGGSPFAELMGLAVDPDGNLWVYARKSNGRGEVDEFNDTGGFVKTFETPRAPSFGLTVDSGSVYVGEGGNNVGKFDATTGDELATISTRSFAGQGVRALAINPATDNLLLDDNETGAIAPSVVVLHGPGGEPYGEPLQDFPVEPPLLSESYGIAVNAASTVYASQRGEGNVRIFDYVILPAVVTGSASRVTETSETLHGTVNPEGEAITECRFEYGTEASYGQSVPCEQTPTGNGAVAVSARAAGLQPLAVYHFRLEAANANGVKRGGDETFRTTTAPGVEDVSFSSIGSTSAAVSAQIAAGGASTGYRLEYGLGIPYESSTPEASVGAPLNQAVGVLIALNGLEPGTLYHFRVVATNAIGSAYSSDFAFSTTASSGTSALTLPDNRVYEMVSPPDNETVFELDNNTDIKDATTLSTVRAAADGNAVAYVGLPPTVGGNGIYTSSGSGNQFMALRNPGGWTATDIHPAPPGEAEQQSEEYQGFSSDLSIGIVNSEEDNVGKPLAVDASPCDALFTHTGDGAFHPLFSGTSMSSAQGCGQGQVFDGSSADNSHILFHTTIALTPQAEEVTVAGEGEENLYDSAGGELWSVNVLNDGRPDPNAAFGAQLGQGSRQANLSNVVSANGSRIFWTDLNEDVTAEDPAGTTRLFARENDIAPQSPVGTEGECAVARDACTVQLDASQAPEGEGAKEKEERSSRGGGGWFSTASGDGSKVFFTDCRRLTKESTAVLVAGCKEEAGPGVVEGSMPAGQDLYEYDFGAPVGSRLVDLTVDGGGDPLGADVQGTIGSSEDGSYVYFIADGALASGATSRSCKAAQDSGAEEKEYEEEQEGNIPAGRGCNLYVFHEGEPLKFIATLAPTDNDLPGSQVNNPKYRMGDWVSELGNRAAEVTPDGRNLVFESRRRLTGYDSVVNGKATVEAFVYEATSSHLSCVSCDPSGASPVPTVAGAGREGEQLLNGSLQGTYMLRWISEDGSRVFFNTTQSLVAQDTNGEEDVYEWERDGAPDCPPTNTSGGCLYLLTGGSSNDVSRFLDASANGSDVFFTTRAKLVLGDLDENVKLYDARIDGRLPEASLACAGTGCQGVPPAPPIFATPSSVTFNGVGNFPPPGATAPKKATKKKASKCSKGKRAVHGKCVKKKAKRVGQKRSKRGRK